MKKVYILLLFLGLAILPCTAQKQRITGKGKTNTAETLTANKTTETLTAKTSAETLTANKTAETLTANKTTEKLTAKTAAEKDSTLAEKERADSALEASVVHVELLGVSMKAAPQEMLDVMDERGIDFLGVDSAEQAYLLTGTLSGMEMSVEIYCNKEYTKMDYIKMSTPLPQPGTAVTGHHMTAGGQHHDFDKLLRWMRKEYDEPDWKGTVRGHRFCRWFSDFDHDIVLIATGRGNAEVYFYENHNRRNIDYYAILKYCERNPSFNVPMMTAEESISWKRNDSIVVKKKHVVKKRYKRRYYKKRKATKRRYAKRKTTKKRRRR